MCCGSSIPADPARGGLRLFLRRQSAGEAGFGLIELLIAMVILNVGLLAIVAAFNSGVITLSRAGRVTTAAVLAEQQLELYRAITYSSIRLAPATIPSSPPYTTDPAYSGSQITTPSCGAGPSYPNECNASRTAIGADGKSYRVDTYIVQVTPSTGPTTGRPVKQVTVVVRDSGNLSRVYAREATIFDQATG